MVTELQFVAIAAYLAWCLISSVCAMLRPDGVDPPAQLVWREHGPAGWSRWRAVHFGLTSANRRVLDQPEQPIDSKARAGLLDTVLQQAGHPDTDAVQFVVVRRSTDDQPTVFVSGTASVGLAHSAQKN
jgi:hypothetical protein